MYQSSVLILIAMMGIVFSLVIGIEVFASESITEAQKQLSLLAYVPYVTIVLQTYYGMYVSSDVVTVIEIFFQTILFVLLGYGILELSKKKE